MDPSYKIRSLFLKTISSFEKLKNEENLKNQDKLKILIQIQKSLEIINNEADTLLNQQTITLIQYEKIIRRIQKLKNEAKKIKKEITNP